MIYLSSIDCLEEGVLRDQFLYAARSFHVQSDNVLRGTIPDNVDVILIQPQDGEHVQGDVGLVDYTHPDSCCYLFGGSDSHLELDGVSPVAKIYIPHAKTWNLFAPQAAAVVLYDRYVKRGGFG